MKVLDMFGTGLPVVARYYKCIEELVQVNKNGVFFEDSVQLYANLKIFFKNEEGRAQITAMRKFIEADIKNNRWSHTWGNIAQPILLRNVSKKHKHS